MSLIYSLVSNGTTILADHATAKTTNISQVSQMILDKIATSDEGQFRAAKLTYVYDNYLFHYMINDDGLVFLCMADDSFGRRIPFAFLEDIRSEFLRSFDQLTIMNATKYGMDEFSSVLADKMDYYNDDTAEGSDRIRHVQSEVDQVRDIMVQNIEKVMERGERIDILVDKTDNLNQAAFQFKKRSTELKRQMWWKNTKITIILALVVVNILYLLIGAGCGFPFFDKCF
jgi:vesicle-associated membrane protein 7